MFTFTRFHDQTQLSHLQGPSGHPAAVPRHDAMTLTHGGSLAHICLNGQEYALRITRQGKLILTK